jgi:cellulose synthase/poly-beta-1,6-N-acetylglucosamine synthase-like glycosyltransferase
MGVVIPAHNEETHIVGCRSSVLLASRHLVLKGEPVAILVVLDDCSDNTSRLVSIQGVATLDVAIRNVGKASATGADHLLAAGANWLASTDADTVVPHDWLTQSRFECRSLP